MAQNPSSKISGVDQIEKAELQTNHLDEKSSYDYDDIHHAALVDNPTNAERLNLVTLLSILFIGMSIVPPIACGFIMATSVLFGIGTDLGDTSNLGWVVSGWSIASSVSFSLAGSLSDIFGRRNVILVGQFVSLIGSIIAAVAPSISVLIGGTALLGFSAGLVLVSYAAVPELCPNKYRALGIASIEGALTIPWVAVAFLLANLLLLNASWRWIYYICIIYSAVCLIGTASFYFPPPRPRNDSGKTRWQEFIELDFVGIVLYTGGLTSVLLALSWGGNPGHAWGSTSVIAPLVIGAVSFLASFLYDFTIVEKTGYHALFPRQLLTKFREFTVSLVVVFISGMVYYTMSSMLPQATQFVYTSDPLKIGVLLLPNGLGQMFGTAIVPLFIHKTGHPTRYLIVAVFLQGLFTGLYAFGIGGHKAAWMAFQFFGAGPFGLITVTTIFNAGLHVRPSELGTAVGLLGTFRSMGGSVGNAVFGTIFRSISTEELPKRIAASALAHGYTGDLAILIPAVINAGLGVPSAFDGVQGVTSAIETAILTAFQQAYAYAYRIVFYSTIPFGVFALLAALLVKDSTQYMTNHTHVHLVKDVLDRKVQRVSVIVAKEQQV